MKENYSFPQALARLPNWLCYRLERDPKTHRNAKVPYIPHTGYKASATDPKTWSTLAQALEAMARYHFSGIGFVFTRDCGYVGVDIDKCLIDGKPNSVASAILKKSPPTYIEISPSDTGLHLFYKGVLPAKGNRSSKTGVEMYGHARYFTMTGKRWPGGCSDEIAVDNGILSWIHSKYIKSPPQQSKKKSTSIQGMSYLSDEQLLSTARAAKDGPAFEGLWEGRWQEKYKSQSEADFALCCKLAFWSNRDTGQIDRLFRLSGLMREKWDRQQGGSTYGEITVRNACDKTSETYVPKRKRPVNIFEQDGCYYRKKGENITQLTNFLVHPVEQIKGEKEAQLTCDLISDSRKTQHMDFVAEDFCNVLRFKKVLNRNSISFCFFGTDGDLEALKQYIDDLPWKIKKGVKALGIYWHNERFVFVTPERAIAAGGVAVDTIVQMEHYRSLESNILDAPFLTDAQFCDLGETLLRYNEPAKTVSILAWCAGCFIKQHLKYYNVMYPHLFLIGESGSGKTHTLRNIILPLFSRSKAQVASQVTNFTLAKDGDSTNVIPHAIDEYKPSTLSKKTKNDLHNYFRGSYEHGEAVRGKANQTVQKYDLLAPVVVAGEESANETAIRERTIELLFSRKDLNDDAQYAVFCRLKDGGLLPAFGRTLLDLALRTPPSEVKRWFDDSYPGFDSEFPSRIASNLACAYAGLKLVEKLCHAYGHLWDGVFCMNSALSLEACSKQLSYAARHYLLDGATHNITTVENSLEIMSRMNLKPGKDFAFEAGTKRLCFSPSKVYDRFTKYRKDYAVEGEVLTMSQFKKQLEHSEYFIAKNYQKRLSSDEPNGKVWVINFELLSQRADVDGFLVREPEADDLIDSNVTFSEM